MYKAMMPPGPQPFYPPPGPPYSGPSAPTEGKAVASLVLGLLSIFGLVCFGGPVLGVPAIILGVLARKDVERSGGVVSGAGIATAGIVTGAFGSFVGFVWIGLMIAGVVAGITSASHAKAVHTPPPTLTVPTTPTAPVTVATTVDVVDLAPSSTTRLRDLLVSQLRTASARGETLLVQTTGRSCGVCPEIDGELGDPRMESALDKVRLVRVDVDRFEADLKAMHMFETTAPWFYKLDATTARAVDAISADEWDDNIAENMAPVLRAFAKGSYTTRRHDTRIGTPL
jgi:hypothetical protein